MREVDCSAHGDWLAAVLLYRFPYFVIVVVSGNAWKKTSFGRCTVYFSHGTDYRTIYFFPSNFYLHIFIFHLNWFCYTTILFYHIIFFYVFRCGAVWAFSYELFLRVRTAGRGYYSSRMFDHPWFLMTYPCQLSHIHTRVKNLQYPAPQNPRLKTLGFGTLTTIKKNYYIFL